MSIRDLIQITIEDIWLNEIKQDYDEYHILNEDSLKIAFCYHLRIKLKDQFAKNNLRIITELNIPKTNLYVDIAIVELHEEKERLLHFSTHIKRILAFIELKFIAIRYNRKTFNQISENEDLIRCDEDLIKLHDEVGKRFEAALLFGAFIDEYFYQNNSRLNRLENFSHLLEISILERLTELNGTNNDHTGEFSTTVYK